MGLGQAFVLVYRWGGGFQEQCLRVGVGEGKLGWTLKDCGFQGFSLVLSFAGGGGRFRVRVQSMGYLSSDVARKCLRQKSLLARCCERVVGALHLCRERIFVELMTSDHKLKASREGSE